MAYFSYRNKRIFYQEIGSGTPLFFLHGNTASSKMFDMLLPLYQDNFKVVFIDFLGNGRSDRMESIPENIWYEEALQTIALTEHLGYKKVNYVGTSGGAWAAVNAALERPALVDTVVADSFDGRTLHDGFAEELLAERSASKHNGQAIQFYQRCQGEYWETAVDFDTQALLNLAQSERPLFQKPLSSLQPPLLLMGSRKDTMVRKDLADEYRAMADTVKHGAIHLFDTGGHPAILSNAEAASKVIGQFVNS